MLTLWTLILWRVLSSLYPEDNLLLAALVVPAFLFDLLQVPRAFDLRLTDRTLARLIEHSVAGRHMPVGMPWVGSGSAMPALVAGVIVAIWMVSAVRHFGTETHPAIVWRASNYLLFGALVATLSRCSVGMIVRNIKGNFDKLMGPAKGPGYTDTVARGPLEPKFRYQLRAFAQGLVVVAGSFVSIVAVVDFCSLEQFRIGSAIKAFVTSLAGLMFVLFLPFLDFHLRGERIAWRLRRTRALQQS